MAMHCKPVAKGKCGTCTFDNNLARMGGDITATSLQPLGIFYLETNDDSPFMIPDHKYLNETVDINSCRPSTAAALTRFLPSRNITGAITRFLPPNPLNLIWKQQSPINCCNDHLYPGW